MHPKFPHVFEPITIRGKTYRNRLVAAPTMFAHSIFTIPPMKENVYRMVENRAKGGFGWNLSSFVYWFAYHVVRFT